MPYKVTFISPKTEDKYHRIKKTEPSLSKQWGKVSEVRGDIDMEQQYSLMFEAQRLSHETFCENHKVQSRVDCAHKKLALKSLVFHVGETPVKERMKCNRNLTNAYLRVILDDLDLLFDPQRTTQNIETLYENTKMELWQMTFFRPISAKEVVEPALLMSLSI